jgi:hypothetical protein
MKRAHLSLLLFWVGAACATASTSPPLGQPSAPYLTSAGGPTAWTLGETDAALRRAIERRSADHSGRLDRIEERAVEADHTQQV